MNAHTNAQIIEQNGRPAFAVIPYDEYLKLVSKNQSKSDKDTKVPHEVVGLVIKKNINLVKAWRIHLGLTQKQVAQKAGISQSALSQMEKAKNNPHSATIEKLADAMGLSTDQLMD